MFIAFYSLEEKLRKILKVQLLEYSALHTELCTRVNYSRSTYIYEDFMNYFIRFIFRKLLGCFFSEQSKEAN